MDQAGPALDQLGGQGCAIGNRLIKLGPSALRLGHLSFHPVGAGGPRGKQLPGSAGFCLGLAQVGPVAPDHAVLGREFALGHLQGSLGFADRGTEGLNAFKDR